MSPSIVSTSQGTGIATVFLAAMLLLLPSVCPAEIILLKDGTRVEAENVQEENGLIRFSLPGYEGIFITYSKDIVAGIYKDGELPPEGAAPDPPAEEPSAEQSREPVAGVQPHSQAEPSPAVPGKTPAEGSVQAPPKPEPEIQPESGAAVTDRAAPNLSPSVYAEYSGIKFYDPRRRYKYWTGPQEKHLRFEDAVEVLAERFGRPPQWIVENLGDANDLGLVHRNLAESLQDKAAEEVDVPPDTVGIQFYDPRRTFKYWSGPDRHHRTLDEAVEALAEQYDRPPGWIKAHLGPSNDLAEIHRNLAAAVRE